MFPSTGRCLCGAVTVKANRAPIRMAQCHCRDCQRVSGTGHTSNALFNAADVEISGETRGFASTADSGNTLTRHFCAACGSRMYATNTARPGMVMLAVGAFDDSSWYSPGAVLYTRSRPVWDPELDGIAAFEAMLPVPPPADTTK